MIRDFVIRASVHDWPQIIPLCAMFLIGFVTGRTTRD